MTYNLTPGGRAARAAPWTCPSCNQTMRVAGKGPHSQWCGDDKEARFWSKVDKNGPGGCWLWLSGKDKWGYGDLRWHGNKHVQAHRMAWKLLRGDPGKLDCLHTCHNPSCCNPEHLYLGTDVENGRDRAVAGRAVRGEAMHTSTITTAQAREIWALKGTMTERAAAAMYDCSQGCIGAIWRKRTWKHIHEAN